MPTRAVFAVVVLVLTVFVVPGYASRAAPAPQAQSVQLNEGITLPFNLSIKAALGPQNLLVIPVQFPDEPFVNGSFNMAQSMAILNAHYIADSYGRMSWNITVAPKWYMLPKSVLYYGVNPFTTGPQAGNATAFYYDSLAAASADVNPSAFTHVMIIYAGWSHDSSAGWTEYLSDFAVKGHSYSFEISVVSDTLGDVQQTIEHEAGHLIGLPDLFYTLGNDTWAIPWDGEGGQAGFDGNATMHCSWSKIELGWMLASNIVTLQGDSTTTVNLVPLGISTNAQQVVFVPVNSTMYYLIEVRAQVGADSNLPPPDTFDQQMHPGVFVLQVGLYQPGLVEWIYPGTGLPSINITQNNAAAFQVGEGYSNPFFSMYVVSNASGDYQVALSTEPSIAVVTTTVTQTSTATSTATRTVTDTSATATETSIATIEETSIATSFVTLTSTSTSVQTSTAISVSKETTTQTYTTPSPTTLTQTQTATITAPNQPSAQSHQNLGLYVGVTAVIVALAASLVTLQFARRRS